MPEQVQAARPFWSGTITFGLVTVPVNLFPANRAGGIHWRMLDQDGKPLRRRFMCPKEDRQVGPDELVRGYEIRHDEYVIVTDEELEKLEPRKSRDIDLRAFVDEEQVSPLYFERSYFLTPAGESNQAYRLLAAVMQRQRQVGIATFVMREKEYLVAIFAHDGILRAETLRFDDEVRTPADVGLPNISPAEKKHTDHVAREIQRLQQSRLEPAMLEDEYAERLQKLLEQKRKRHQDTVKIDDQEPEEPGDIDLVAVIKRSLGALPDDRRSKSAGPRLRIHKPKARSGSRPSGAARRRRAG